ncbi:hypothetical protein AB4383_01345 [Vibrio breoganii]
MFKLVDETWEILCEKLSIIKKIALTIINEGMLVKNRYKYNILKLVYLFSICKVKIHIPNKRDEIITKGTGDTNRISMDSEIVKYEKAEGLPKKNTHSIMK